MSSIDGNAVGSISPSKAGIVLRYPMAAMGLFVIVAVLCHAGFMGIVWPTIGKGGGERGAFAVETVTWTFAGVGAAFWGLTWLSHFPLVQTVGQGNRNSLEVANSQVSAAANDLGPVGGLLISMAIRVAGTFAILGLLWKSGLVSREELVFDVLFWYVTLTAMEVVGIVWAPKSLERNLMFESGSQTSNA